MTMLYQGKRIRNRRAMEREAEHGVTWLTSTNFLTLWKTSPYPRLLSSSDMASSQSDLCSSTFPGVKRLKAYPRQVLTLFRLVELHRRRHGKCIGYPDEVSTMMQLSDSLWGELQIAKQKDRIAHCRVASPGTHLQSPEELKHQHPHPIATKSRSLGT
jgi:hypothetical protein